MIKIYNFSQKGVTFTELLVIIGILIILTLISVPAFRYFQGESDLQNGTEEIIATLRLAQSKTLASEGASQYGVYFNASVTPHQYVLFKGESYDLRDPTTDEVHNLPQAAEISQINLGGESEIVFERLTGTSSQSGDITLSLKTTPSKTRTIYIETSGQVSLTSPSFPSDTNRIKDSRHVHFGYSRSISTAAEKIVLSFTHNSTITNKEIVIADNLKESQIYWEGEVEVGGTPQKIKLHTHRLNNPDTQLCIHRDRRYNTKALVVTISGDTSGNLIEYSIDGLTTTFTSIYVNDLTWQ